MRVCEQRARLERKLQLALVIGRDLWEIGLKKARLPAAKPTPPRTPTAPKVQAFGLGALGGLLLLGLLL